MTKKMNKPHVHAKVIKAWADGAKIQLYSEGERGWEDIVDPTWLSSLKYRIKPEPKKVEVHLYRVRGSDKGTITSKVGERFSPGTEATYYEYIGSHTFEVEE